MAITIEHQFPLFSDEEVHVGRDYVLQKYHLTLDYARLRRLANTAGTTRINAEKKLTPRESATRALRAFEREFPGSKMSERYFEGYVHAIAKMLAERSPRTRAKRQREKEMEELHEATAGLEDTSPIDPEINRQLSLAIFGNN